MERFDQGGSGGGDADTTDTTDTSDDTTTDTGGLTQDGSSEPQPAPAEPAPAPQPSPQPEPASRGGGGGGSSDADPQGRGGGNGAPSGGGTGSQRLDPGGAAEPSAGTQPPPIDQSSGGGPETRGQERQDLQQQGDLNREQGVETGSDAVAGQARDLEQRVVDDVDGVDSAEDVTVERDGDRLVADLTSAGAEGRREFLRDERQAAGRRFDRSGPNDPNLSTSQQERLSERREGARRLDRSGPNDDTLSTSQQEQIDERRAGARRLRGDAAPSDAGGDTGEPAVSDGAPDAGAASGGGVFGAITSEVDDRVREATGGQGRLADDPTDLGAFGRPADPNPPAPADDETFFDQQLAGFEAETGIGIPGEGDVVQGIESELEGASEFVRSGQGPFVTPDEAEQTAETLVRTGPLGDIDEGEFTTTFSDETVSPAEASERFVGEGARTISEVQDVPGAILGAGRLGEGVGEQAFNSLLAQSLPEEGGPGADVQAPFVDDTFGEVQGDTAERAAEGRAATVETATQLRDDTVEGFRERPFETTGALAGELTLLGASAGAGAAAGRGAGTFGRLARDRVRTAGARRVDLDDVTQESVVRNVETGGAEGDRFPGADDPGLFRSDPAEAVRQQADDRTPDAVRDEFEAAGVDDGVVLKKALDVEPEGGGPGGFTSAPAESLDEFDYELPGSFFGPDLSPNFLRVGDPESAGFSLRPGLPDTGNNPTAVFARTGVENPDANDLPGLQEELIDRSGDTTAVTKPSGDVNVDEIEAIVPPGSEFAPVSSGGRATQTARRFGIGADFFTEVGGRRVPFRLVAPADEIGDAGSAGRRGGGGGADAGTQGAPLQSFVEAPEPATDRPVPTAAPSSSVPSGPSVDSGVPGASPGTSGNPSAFDSRVDESDPFRVGDTSRQSDAPSGTRDTGSPAQSPPPSDGGGGASSPGGSRPAGSGGASGGLFGESPTSAPSGGSGSPPGSAPPSSPPGSSGPPASPPGSGGPPSDVPGSPFGSFTPSEPAQGSPAPSQPSAPPMQPFGSPPRRPRDDRDDRRRDDGDDVFGDDFGGESPVFTNPIAGVGGVFGEGSGDGGAFGPFG